MSISLSTIKTIFSRIPVKRGPNTGTPLKGQTLRRYIDAFWSVYKDIGDSVYDSAVLEGYLIEERDNDHTRKVCVIAIMHFMDSFKGADEWELKKGRVQTLAGMLGELCKDESAKEESMAKKRGLIGQYRFIRYKELLLSLAAGVDSPGIRNQQMKLAFLLLAANEPLRCDYQNIVVADRFAVRPSTAPYYKDGFINFPAGSTVKVLNAEMLVQDVREYQVLIDLFISGHSSTYLFGCYMEPVTFAHLLLDGSEMQLGVRLGIRFFRTKFSSDNWETIHGAVQMCKGMNNKLPTQDRYYAVKP